MKHSFKRLLSMVLALAMVLSCVPVQAFAEECAHEYDIVITGPSCTEPGSMVYTCGLCGDTYEEEGEEPSGHDYAVDEVPATCLEDGLVTYVCTVCGESETEEIGAPGHCYVDGACEVCGEADPEAEEPEELAEEEPVGEPEDELVVEELDPVDSDGELVGGAEVSEAAAFDLATEIANADGAYTLTQGAEADFLILPDNFALTVASGVTLTINTQIIVQNGATLTFEEGAYYDDNNESDMPVFFMTMPAPYEATIFGVDTSDIWVQYVVTNMNTLASALEAAGGCNYYKGNATFYPNVQIQGVTNAAVDAVTVPENVILELAKGASLTINNLTNNGTVRVKEGCSLWVPENGLTNNGVIEGEGTKPGEGGDIDMSETAVAQLGEDGETFATLEEAIAAAAAIDIDERPFVSLLTDYTVNETIVIDEAINIFYIGGDGNNPTITAAEGVDTLFEITENGELLLNDIDMVTPGDYIINITGDNATFMAVNCNLNGGGEAAINVADDVNWYYPPTDQGIPTTIQVYNSTVGGRTALHLGGSNTTATFAPGNESGAVELMGDNPDGVIVIDGDGHDVKMYGVSIETSAGNNNAFTMNGDSVIEIAGGSFNGDSVDDRFNGWGEPLPQSGAVARANAQYFGSLQSALDAAAEYEFEEGEVPLTILEELTIDNTVTLPETKTDIRMLGENITLTETGAINVYGKMSLELDGDNRIWMGLGTVHVFQGGDLWNDWQVIGHVTWEENGNAPHLSAYWVHEQGEGWFENIYEYHPNLDMRMAPGEDHCLSFYKNVWDPDNGRWIRTSVGPDEMTLSEGLTAYAMTEQDWVEGNFKEGEANYENFVQLYVKNDAPWDEQQTITVDDVPYTVYVEIDPDQGFYAGPEATNENWLIKYRYNKFREENSFYFIFTREGYTLQRAYLKDESSATIKSTENPNIWKITMKPEAMELTEDGYYRDFEIRVFMEVKENGYDHIHNWDYAIWYEPFIWNVQAGDDISHVDMMFAIDSFHNVDSGALGWIMDGDLTLDPNVNDGELDIDMGWRDDEQRFFRLSDECGKGVLTVRSGTKLIVNSPLEIYGGKIIIEDGGEMIINQPVVVSGGDIFEDLTYGNGSIEVQTGGKLTITDDGELFIAEKGSLAASGTLDLTGGMTTIQGAVTLDSDATLNVAGSHLMEVGSRGTLTVANSENVALAEGDSIRVFLPNDKVSGIDGLWGTWLVEEADAMQTAVNDFAENGKYANYGIKEIAPYYSMTLTDHITIADDVRLLLYPWEGPVILTVPAGKTLTNYGEIYAGRDCHIVGDGGFINNGTIIEEGVTLPDLQKVIYEAYERGEREVWIHENAVLAGDLWIPEELQVFAEDVTITVPEDETLHLAGSGMNLLGTEMNVLGTLNTYAPLYVNDDSYLHVAGEGALTMESNSVVTIQGNMSLDAEATLSLSENAKIEVGSHGNLTAETDTEITSDGAIWVFLPGGTTTNIPKNAMEGVIYDPEDLDEALTTAATYTDQYSSVRLEIWDRIIHVDDEITIPANVVLALNNSGDGYYEELIIPEGKKLTNNGTIVLNEETALRIFGELENNGEIIVNMWACVNNYGDPDVDENDFILNGGEYYEGNMSQAALQAKLDELVTSNAGGWIHESVTRLEENMTIDLGIRESDGAERAFWVDNYGKIVVPDGVTLTLESPTSLNGGQIIVEAGGTLITNNKLHIGSGTLYLEDGAVMEGSWEPMGPVTYEGEQRDHISAAMVGSDYNEYEDKNFCYDTIDEWDWGIWYEHQMLPGYGRSMIFYFNHWNEDELIWERTPIHPDELSFSDGLEIVPLWEESDRFVPYGGQKNEDCFVMLKVKYDQSLWDTEQYVYYGDDHSFTVRVQRDQESGFYSSAEVSNETFLDQFGFVPGGDNEFYFIITDPNLTGLNFYAELQAGPEIVSGGIYHEKVADNVWKLTLDEYTSYNMDRNYWLQVRVEVEDTWGNRWNLSNGLNVEPWIWNRGMPDAMITFNEEEYRYYAVADVWQVNRWVEDGEGGYWSDFDIELPEGVSYDYDSNTLTLTLTLNGANLNYLGVGYHWSNGNEEGYNLPNADLTIEVQGENSIGGGQAAFDIRGGANVTIVGDGSLTIWNNNDNGTMWSQNAVNVEDSILTIGGSVDITMAVSGENWWDFGNGLEPCTMHAIQGGETSNLIITDSAKVSVHVPDLRADETSGEGFNYRGLANFANVTVEKRATLNLDTLHLNNGQTFTQNGGTINIDDPGTIIYMDDQGNTRKVYEPVVIREGSRMLITGGTMNLTLDDTDTNARGAIIKVENDSELQISGGQITINNNVKAPGIYVSGDSRLFFTGGTMYYNGTMFEDGERTAFINVDGQANFTGGTIRVENGVFNFYGWNENAPMIQWMGTNLIAKNTIIDQNGSFRMTGGKMQLTNSRFHSNNNTVFAGGTMDMDNSVLIVNGYTGAEGVALLDFDVTDAFYTDTSFEGTTFQDNCAIEVNNYFPVEGFANIDIDASFEEQAAQPFAGIRNYASYQQMGGTVSIDTNVDHPVFWSNGRIMLNAGTMNLKGEAGIQQYPNEVENEADKNFFDMHEGFSLNVDAAYMGLELRTNSSIQGGNLNVKATGEGGVGVYVSNDAELEIMGGNHTIQANHIGIMADHGTVKVTEVPSDFENDVIEKPEINVEAGHAALYSRMEADEICIEFAEDSIFDKDANATAGQWVQEQRADDNCFRYGLSSDGENFAKNIKFNQAPQKLQDVLPTLERDGDAYMLGYPVIVDEDTTLEVDGQPIRLDVIMSGKITVRNGATLTIPEGSELWLCNRGTVIAEADSKVENNGVIVSMGGSPGVGGTFIVQNSENYIHGEDAVFVTEFNENGIFRTVGVDESYQELQGSVESTEMLKKVLAEAQKPYRYVSIWTPNDVCLDDLFIPYNTDVWIDSQDETPAEVTLNPGQELTIEGALNLGNADFTVAGDLFSVGSIQTDIEDAAKITVTGKIYNHGEIGLNNAELKIDGGMDNVGFMAVNNDSVVNVNGMLDDYGYLWVGREGNGTVNVDGELNVHQNMTVYENGTVNVNADAALRVCNYYEDGMNSDNCHLDVYGAVNVAGALENSGALNLYGTVNVSEGGTLINDFEICMWDTENQRGAKLIVDGTFVNNVALYNASYGGVVDVTNGTFINREADPDDPYDYDAEILTRYFEDDSIAAMDGIAKNLIILTYEGASTTTANAMAEYAEVNGYGNSLFRVDGAALVAAGEQLTVNTIVMLPGSQLGVNGGLTVNYLLRMRADTEMSISSSGIVNILGALRVDPADDYNGLEAAVLNNKGILECGAYGVLDICGEYNDSGKVYIYMEPTEYNDGYNVGTFTEECVISEENAILVMDDADNEWQVIDLLTWIMEGNYHGGLIRIDSDVNITYDLYIPDNVTVEIYGGSLNMAAGTLINDGTIEVKGLHAGVTRDNGTFGGTGTYSGHCGENTTWSVKNGILTISGRGEMGDSYEEPLPWADFDDAVTKIVLGSDVTNIGGGAFGTFNATITIPSTVTEIGISALGTCTLKIYHDSYAETYVKDPANGIDESKILYFHVIDPESGVCEHCDYSIYQVIEDINNVLSDESAMPEEKAEQIKSIDTEELKTIMEKSESDPENDLVEQLDQLEQEVKNVTGLDVGIKHSEDVSEEIADAFSNVSEDAAIIGAVLNAEEGVEEVNLVIGDPETTLDEEETRDYNMDASVHFSMTMEGVGNASQLDVPVKITLPVPGSITKMNKVDLELRHYHDGSADGVSVDFNLFQENGSWFISFYVSGFSDFLLAQRATPITLTARINHKTVTEGTNPDDIFISVTAREKATNKTVSGLSTNYIIRDAEGNEVELEEALAKAGTYTVEPHCLVLDAQYVIMEDADVVTATLTVEAAEEAEYVCVNTTTGEQYESLADALEAADDEISGIAGNETIKMMEDCSENYFIVPTGTTLDLNGRTLTAKAVSAVDGAHIVDSTDGNGKLVISMNRLSLDDKNEDLPVYTGTGYVFAPTLFALKENKNYSGEGFCLNALPAPDMSVVDMFKDGVEDNNLQIVIRLTWDTDNGTKSQDLAFSENVVKQVYQSNQGSQTKYKLMFEMIITGIDNVNNLKANVLYLSGTNAEIAKSVPLSIKS